MTMISLAEPVLYLPDGLLDHAVLSVRPASGLVFPLRDAEKQHGGDGKTDKAFDLAEGASMES